MTGATNNWPQYMWCVLLMWSDQAWKSWWDIRHHYQIVVRLWEITAQYWHFRRQQSMPGTWLTSSLCVPFILYNYTDSIVQILTLSNTSLSSLFMMLHEYWMLELHVTINFIPHVTEKHWLESVHNVIVHYQDLQLTLFNVH
jgi:hypothetical protein